MTDNTQPEALRLANALEYCDASVARQAINELRSQHARIADLEAQLAAIGAGGVSLLIDQQTRDSFTAADMATAEARGFRDGVASVAANAGEPVAWRSWDSENSRWNFTLWPDEWAGHADVWEPLYTYPAAPVAQGDALTDTYVQQVPDKCDRIVWRGRYYHLPIDAAEHSYTEPSPMAKVAAALRQKAEQEDAAYQARRSDQGLMESEWGPMEDAPPHEDPPMHVAVVEGDDTVRTLQWNRDVAAFAYPAGTLLYAARSQAKEGE